MDSGGQWANNRDSRKWKPPPVPWKPSISSWEKEFYKVVGQMEWGTFLHMKKFTHFYPDVNSWDDSAGKEAIDNAWKRFWCRKKGLICDTVPLPDPDLYNDIIDWDAEVDPELCHDIENIPVIRHTEEEQHKAPAVNNPLPTYQNIQPTGWGDIDENFDPLPVYTPTWPNAGPSPTYVWQLGSSYPTPGGGWSYDNNYLGPPELWSYNNVATSSSHAFGPGSTTWRAQADGGQMNQP